MKISVVIPTYNRADRLKKTLAHLEQQTISKDQLEVIIINDGSTDHTEEFLQDYHSTIDLTYKTQANGGAGSARNLGIKQAKYQIILFIGDDIYAEPDFLKIHQQFHQQHPEVHQACLGLSEWYKETCNTPFMHWLTHGGHQFAYHKLQSGQQVNYQYFYTSNISLKKELLQKEQFSDKFTVYGWEDIELAYRLQKKHNLQITYQPQALAYHDDPVDLEKFHQRMINVGRSAQIFQQLHPELQIIPTGKKLLAYKLLTNPLIRTLSKVLPKKLHWYIMMKYWYLQGTRNLSTPT